MEAEERISTSSALPALERPPHLAMDDADLSDDAIERLLSQAETRLASKTGASSSLMITSDSKREQSQRELSRFPTAPVQSTKSIARIDPKALVANEEKDDTSLGIKKIEDPVHTKKAKKEKKATAGPDWFHMPRTDLTPQLKRDLQVLRMRNVLDPKRHYKKDNSRPAVPEFSQVGTIIEGSTDFFSGRLTKKQRKRTLLEGVLDGEKQDGRFKRKYDELNQRKRSGKKGYYKDLLKKRYGSANVTKR